MDANSGSLQRSLADEPEIPPCESQEPLLRQIRALEDEVRALRVASQEKDLLEGMVGQLREANENLVLATVSAQGLRDEAEATNRRQNEFLAMLAHELRNPLAPISMAAALMERIPNASPQSLNLTQVIGRQVGHMAHLLDDLLDAARISSGKITLSNQPTLLSEVLDQTIETIQPRIKERRQQLRVEIPAEPIITHGDKVRLTQVFTNLLGNASKYTEDGGQIRLAAALAGNEIVITVEDSGTGIAPDVLPHIFDLFTQGPRSLARSEGGLGIGLNVVRNLVSMHGGAVQADSPGVGAGSTFTVRLPVSSQALQACAPPQRGQRAGTSCRLLLIEDNADSCDTLKHFLVMEGHEVSTAYDGKAGLAAAIDGRFDVVICDIGLPGLDGFDLIKALRQSPAGRQAYAIALSGYCQVEDRARALEAGFDDYLVKPVGPEALLAVIGGDECLARRR